MKKEILVLAITSSLIFASCKGGSSENQGYDSGPTTKSESGSGPSGGSGETTDTTSVEETE